MHAGVCSGDADVRTPCNNGDNTVLRYFVSNLGLILLEQGEKTHTLGNRLNAAVDIEGASCGSVKPCQL